MNLYVQLAKYNIIETQRLFLRPFSMDDLADMYEYASKPENLRFVFPAHLSREQTADAIANNFMKAPLGKWAIEIKAEQKMLGTIDFTKISEANVTAEIGYVLNQNYWGQGLMTEALKNLTDFSFREFGLKKLIILVDSENIASQKVAQKVGYSHVKRFKGSNKYSRQLREFERYELTKREYLS